MMDTLTHICITVREAQEILSVIEMTQNELNPKRGLHEGLLEELRVRLNEIEISAELNEPSAQVSIAAKGEPSD